MAGLGVGGWGNFPGQPQNTPIANPQQNIPSPGRSRGNFRNMQGRGQGMGRGEGMDTGPSRPQPFRGPKGGGGINTGRTSLLGILPSAQDPFRTYGSVENGRMTPPQNPYGQNQPIRFTPGGEFGGGGPGPINTGPSPNMPPPITPMPNIPMGQPQKPLTQPLMNPIPGPIATPPPMQAPGPRDYNMGMPQIPQIQTGPTNPPPPNPYLERGGFTGGQMPPDIQSESSGATGYYQPPSMIPNMSPMDTPRGRGGLGQMYGGAGPSLSGSFKRGLFY